MFITCHTSCDWDKSPFVIHGRPCLTKIPLTSSSLIPVENAPKVPKCTRNMFGQAMMMALASQWLAMFATSKG